MRDRAYSWGIASRPITILISSPIPERALGHEKHAARVGVAEMMGEEGDAGALGVEPVLVRLGGGGRGDAKEQDAEQPASSIFMMIPGSFHGTRASGVAWLPENACSMGSAAS